MTEKIERQGFGYIKPEIDLDEIQKFSESHGRMKNVVREVLEGWDKATNNDVLLYFEVLRCLELIKITYGKEDVIIRIKYPEIPYIPSPESITRARRSLNSLGIGLPTSKAVFLKRQRRQSVIRQYFSGRFE